MSMIIPAARSSMVPMVSVPAHRALKIARYTSQDGETVLVPEGVARRENTAASTASDDASGASGWLSSHRHGERGVTKHMERTGNTVCGTLAREGIEVAVQDFMTERKPQHGGELVAQAKTLSGRIFRARDGWVIELCRKLYPDAHVYIGHISSSVVRKAPIELFDQVGAEELTKAELEAAKEADEALENARRSAAIDAELEALFRRISAEYPDSPEIEYASSHCSVCGANIDMRKYVVKLPCGSILCSRCTYRPAAAAAE